MPMVADDETEEDLDTPGDDLRAVLGMPPRRAPPILTPGQIIDDAYRIDSEIGAGGMGRVYRAHDLRLSRDVALKLHQFALVSDDDTLRREATALARLAHPNVVTVYEVGMWNGHPWVAMEYVKGGNARSWLRDANRTPREILSLFIAAGRGLAAAHAAGLVHRDFKPDNVLVGEDGRARVADFGLARDTDTPEHHVGDIIGTPALSLSTRTKTGTVRGTPAYMAPEQRTGARVSPAADQYGFAVSVWEALARKRPFTDDGVTVVAAPAGTMPRHVEAALRRALSEDPDRRWPSLSALLDELARDPARTRRRIAIAAVAIVALVGGGYALAARENTTIVAAPACGVVDELAATWSAPQRDAVRGAYAGEVGGRVAAAIDAWAERWRDERTAVCESADPPALIAVRDTCLDRARASLSSSLEVLAEAKLSPLQALTTASSLPHVEDCRDGQVLAGEEAQPTQPGAIASSRALDALLAASQSWAAAGQYPRALAIARDAVDLAHAIGTPGARARAEVRLASALNLLGQHDGVVERYESAARLAAEAHDDVLVARCYLAALGIVTVDEKAGEADRLLSVADIAIARAGSPAVLVEELLGRRADLASKREQFADALPLHRQATALAEARYGLTSQDLAQRLNALGTTLGNLRKFDEARAALERAAEIMEKLFGTYHPNLGVILNSVGSLELEMGNPPAAVKTYRRALAVKEATLGPQHRGLVPVLINLSNALDQSLEFAEAVQVAQRGLALAEQALPPNHPKLAMMLNNLATAQLDAEDWVGAAVTVERVQKILEPLGAKGEDPDALRNLAKLRAHEKKYPAALTAARRSVVIARQQGGDSSMVLLAALDQLAQIERAAKDPHADETYRQAIELSRTLVGPQNPMTVRLEQTAAKR